MAATTARKPAARVRSTRLDVPGIVNPVYATPTGLKTSARGPVVPPASVYGNLPKGTARRLRKAAHAAGYVGHAAAR